MMTENISSRTHYDCENSTDDWDSENGQVADGLIKGYPKLTSRPIHEPNERLAKRCRHLPVVETAAGCTSALAGDATREHLGPPQRLPDGSFPPTSSEAQEVFGRGILRIQPHGHRNVYVITFLPDVVQPASMSSTSEISCEKSSHFTGNLPVNPSNAPVAGSVLGAQTDLPIDPLILADEGPCDEEGLRRSFSLGDDPRPSETTYPYPDPPPVFSSAPDQQDSVVLWQGKDAPFISSPHDRHSVVAGNPSSSNHLGPAHGGRQSKSLKRKPHRLDGQRPKRARDPQTSTAEGNSLAALHTHFLSLPLDKRLQFLPRLLEGALPHHMPMPDLLTTGNGDARSPRRLTQPSDGSEPHRSFRKGMPWSLEETELLLRLRRDEQRPWSEVTMLFSDQFPGRSPGSIQIYWSTTLKKRAYLDCLSTS
ncbi:hypothetical protein MAP00_004597 [Monascus purpureus]|nr:hypothetical protein MAP00_004597 [Monascus purpureus]